MPNNAAPAMSSSPLRTRRSSRRPAVHSLLSRALAFASTRFSRATCLATSRADIWVGCCCCCCMLVVGSYLTATPATDPPDFWPHAVRAASASYAVPARHDCVACTTRRSADASLRYGQCDTGPRRVPAAPVGSRLQTPKRTLPRSHNSILVLTSRLRL